MVVRALRTLGYDFLAVSEVMQRSVDSDLIAQATRERRIVLSEYKESGWLAFVRQVESGGAILSGFSGNARVNRSRQFPQL